MIKVILADVTVWLITDKNGNRFNKTNLQSRDTSRMYSNQEN